MLPHYSIQLRNQGDTSFYVDKIWAVDQKITTKRNISHTSYP